MLDKKYKFHRTKHKETRGMLIDTQLRCPVRKEFMRFFVGEIGKITDEEQESQEVETIRTHQRQSKPKKL